MMSPVVVLLVVVVTLLVHCSQYTKFFHSGSPFTHPRKYGHADDLAFGATLENLAAGAYFRRTRHGYQAAVIFQVGMRQTLQTFICSLSNRPVSTLYVCQLLKFHLKFYFEFSCSRRLLIVEMRRRN